MTHLISGPLPDQRTWEKCPKKDMLIRNIIWRCPKIGVSPVIIHFERWAFPHCNPSVLGYAHFWKPASHSARLPWTTARLGEISRHCCWAMGIQHISQALYHNTKAKQWASRMMVVVSLTVLHLLHWGWPFDILYDHLKMGRTWKNFIQQLTLRPSNLRGLGQMKVVVLYRSRPPIPWVKRKRHNGRPTKFHYTPQKHHENSKLSLSLQTPSTSCKVQNLNLELWGSGPRCRSSITTCG